MTERLLFVVAEIGAARFIEPLWRRWLATQNDFEWRVVAAAEMAANYLLETDLANALPMLAPARLTDENLERRLGNWMPTAIVASAGDHYPLEAAAVALARDLAVPSAQYIDTWYNYRRRFEHSGGLVYPDHILVIDDLARREAVGDGLPPERMVVVGQPAWEHSPPLDWAPRDQVLFLGAPIRRDYGFSLGFDEETVWRVVLEAAEICPGKFRRLMYGSHPGQSTIISESVEPAVLVEDSMAALKQAGVVLGIFSSPMIDAYIGGRRVVSVQPNVGSRDYCPLSRHGRIARVGDARSLIEALDASFSEPSDFARALSGSTDRLEKWLWSALGTRGRSGMWKPKQSVIAGT